LTEGRPRLMQVVAASGHQEEQVLGIAAALERGSEHPLAAAIVAGAGERRAVIPTAHDFRSLTGKGVTANVEGRAVSLGNEALLADLRVAPGALAADA